MPERGFFENSYQIGFNGQTKEDEALEGVDVYNFTYREYDAKLGRFLSVDPVAKHFRWNTPFAFADNRVIDGIDFEGLEVVLINPKEKEDKIIYDVGINHHDDTKTDVYAHANPTRAQDQSSGKVTDIKTSGELSVF